MNGKVFVSYRRLDDKNAAARIRDRLAHEFGADNVFMDVDNLLPGQRFDQELDKSLGRSSVLLAIIGAKWVELLGQRGSGEADYVQQEIASALSRGLTVIPVMIENAPLPSAEELPEDLRSLVLHQKLDVRYESFGRDVDQLVSALRRLVPSPSPGWSKRRMAAASVIGAASLVGAVVAIEPARQFVVSNLGSSGSVEKNSQGKAVGGGPLQPAVIRNKADAVPIQVPVEEANADSKRVAMLTALPSPPAVAAPDPREFERERQREREREQQAALERRFDQERLARIDAERAMERAVEQARIDREEARKAASAVIARPPPTPSAPPRVAALPAAPSGGSYRIRSDVSQGIHNMRTGPGQGHARVVSIPANSTGVEVYMASCRKADDGASQAPWCRISWRGHSGWASMSGITR